MTGGKIWHREAGRSDTAHERGHAVDTEQGEEKEGGGGGLKLVMHPAQLTDLHTSDLKFSCF